MKFYIFHVTNPDEFEAGTASPVFTQNGPYSYRQSRSKVNITQNRGPTRVSFEEVKSYFFEEESSCEGCTEDDLYDVVNVPFIVSVPACCSY
jgi:hypothetical protein